MTGQNYPGQQQQAQPGQKNQEGNNPNDKQRPMSEQDKQRQNQQGGNNYSKENR